jgi:hypothetical protein
MDGKPRPAFRGNTIQSHESNRTKQTDKHTNPRPRFYKCSQDTKSSPYNVCYLSNRYKTPAGRTASIRCSAIYRPGCWRSTSHTRTASTILKWYTGSQRLHYHQDRRRRHMVSPLAEYRRHHANCSAHLQVDRGKSNVLGSHRLASRQ